MAITTSRKLRFSASADTTDEVDGVKAVEPHGHISKAELNVRKGKWTD
jgi:hypothetical protein